MNFEQIMQMAGQLREQLQSAQAQVASLRVPGESGGGLVRVVMNGRHELVEVHVDPKALEPVDVALLQDLVCAAVNQASAKVAEALRERLGVLAQGLGFDPSALVPPGSGPR